MQATVGDHVVVRGHRVGELVRRGTVIDVRGSRGMPPYLVRWEVDGHEGLFVPGPDARLERSKASKGKPRPKTR